jgi:P-type Cu+ transporter
MPGGAGAGAGAAAAGGGGGDTGPARPVGGGPPVGPAGPPAGGVCGSSTCKCGATCKCTEEFCCSKASSVLNSLLAGGGGPTVPKVSGGGGGGSTNAAAAAAAVSLRQQHAAAASASASSSSSARVGQQPQQPQQPQQQQQQQMQQPQQNQQPQTPRQREANLIVAGMTCSMCSRAIETALKKLPGVVSVSVSLATDTAHVVFWNETATTATAAATSTTTTTTTSTSTSTSSNRATTTVEKIKSSIEDIGYNVEEVMLVQQPLPQQHQQLGTGQGLLAGNDAAAAGAGAGAGAGGSVPLAHQDSVQERWQGIMHRQEKKVADRRRAFLWSLLGTIPILFLTMILPHLEATFSPIEHVFSFLHVNVPIWPLSSWWWWSHNGCCCCSNNNYNDSHHFNSSSSSTAAIIVVQLRDLLLFLLATPVQFITGWEFYKMTYYSVVVSGTLGMDVLVALGTTAAYGYAVSGTFHRQQEQQDQDTMSSPHFFETSAVLISFVLAGKWMQAFAVRRTSSALLSLMQLQSTTAVKITPLQQILSQRLLLQQQQQQQDLANSSHSNSDNGDYICHRQQQATISRELQRPFNPLVDPYQERLVSIPEVQAGDVVKVIRGASIPADGRVVFGEMSVDESMVTGESIPVLKTAGAVVLGGTVCVETGSLSTAMNGGGGTASVGAAFVEVTGVGADTALAKIIQLVSDAQTRVVPIQTFADQVSSIFVPTVCTVSLLTYMIWYALCSAQVVPPAWYQDLNEDPVTFSLLFGIACLVISCPCALGLATPTAVMVGTGVGARVGVLMKGGEALEVASKVDTVVFDKTGTLTKGTPVITDYRRMDINNNGDVLSTIDDDYLLWLLGSVERTSEHPLAKAVVTYAEEQIDELYLAANPFVQPTSFTPLTGRGASGTIAGSKRVDVGNRLFAQELHLQVPVDVEVVMQELEQQGKTAILVAVDGSICLVMGIADQLKSDAAASIAYLRGVMKVDVWMVTGDNSRTANAIARQLGLATDRVISEALPAAKVHQVRRLQEEDRIVAMIGDGVNDSPALAQADVGLSLGTGAEIAAEASDMVLVKGDVTDVCTALHLSRAIFRRIQMNLLFSLLYNILGIPIAAGVFYPFVKTRLPPTLAALAMGLSSISVVLSSLSLRLYRPPKITGNNSTRQGRSLAISPQRSERRNDSAIRTGAIDENDLTVNLLSNDNLEESEMTDATIFVDNRTSQTNRFSNIV